MSIQSKSLPLLHTPEGHEYRQQLIRQAAYFRAQQRRSCVEHDIEDWLNAEREVEGMVLLHPRRP